MPGPARPRRVRRSGKDQRDRLGRQLAAAVDGDHVVVAVDDGDRHRLGEHGRRQRIGEAPRPRPRALSDDRPVTPRHEHLPLGEPAPAADLRSDDAGVPEHRLHARECRVHALLGTRAEQPLHVMGCRIHLLGRDPHLRDGALETALGELPAHPVDHGCGVDLHTCAQCVHFDTSAPFECQQRIPARVSPKDARNTCTFYEPRTTVERETKSAAPASARKAFDDLFK